jgi:hypothetical protein
MDLAETVGKMVLATNAAGEITIDTFKALMPTDIALEDIEGLIDTLKRAGNLDRRGKAASAAECEIRSVPFAGSAETSGAFRAFLQSTIGMIVLL